MHTEKKHEAAKAIVKKYLSEQTDDFIRILDLYYVKELDAKEIVFESGYENIYTAEQKKFECLNKLADAVIKFNSDSLTVTDNFISLELIEKYFDSKLSQRERINFEAKLTISSQLLEDCENYIAIVAGIKELGQIK